MCQVILNLNRQRNGAFKNSSHDPSCTILATFTITPSFVLKSVEFGIAKQLCERVQRGIEFVDDKNMWASKSDSNSKRALVVSGGVASNQRIRNLLEQVIRIFGEIYHML